VSCWLKLTNWLQNEESCNQLKWITRVAVLFLKNQGICTPTVPNKQRVGTYGVTYIYLVMGSSETFIFCPSHLVPRKQWWKVHRESAWEHPKWNNSPLQRQMSGFRFSCVGTNLSTHPSFRAFQHGISLFCLPCHVPSILNWDGSTVNHHLISSMQKSRVLVCWLKVGFHMSASYTVWCSCCILHSLNHGSQQISVVSKNLSHKCMFCVLLFNS